MGAKTIISGTRWLKTVSGGCLAILAFTATALPATISVPAGGNIQTAINAAAPGDTVFLSNGTFVVGATLNVTKGITLQGESEDGVIINASSIGGSSYGIYVEASGVTLRDFTLMPPTGGVLPPNTPTAGGYGIHASYNHTAPVAPLNNLTLANITIENGYRTAFDIHGYDGVTLSGLTANNCVRGNGIQLTGCTDATITGCSALGNAWGGLAFYASRSTYLNRPCSSITYDMAANTGINQPVYVEDEAGLTNSVTMQGATYLIYNNYNPGVAAMWMYIDGTQADAIAIAQALDAKYSNTISEVTNAVTGNAVIAPGLSTIQAAIDAAAPGDTIELAAGTYIESNIALNKPITIEGADRATVILAPAAEDGNLAHRWNGVFQHGFIVTTNGVSIRNLTIDGQANGALTPGKSNFRTGIVTDDRVAALSVNNLTISNVAVQNAYFYGISVRNTGSNLNVSANRIANIAYGAYPSYGLLTFASGRITDNELVNPGYRAIGVANASVLVSNNTVSTAIPGDPAYGSEGIYVSCFTAATAAPVVTANTIWLTNSGTTSSGMNLVGLTDDTVIESNVIHLEANSAPDVGLLSWWNVGMPLLQSNVVTAAGADTGTQIFHHEDPSEAPIFRGNTFAATSSDGTNPGQGTGMFVTDDGTFFGDENGITYAIIQGNTISGFARGIDLYQGAATPVGGRVVRVEISGNNTITASPSGIGIRVVEEDATGARAQAIITDNSASIHGQAIGILVDGGSSTITNNAIYDNGIGVLVTNLGIVTAFSDNSFEGGAAADNDTDLQIVPNAASVAIGGNNAFAGDAFYLINRIATGYDLSSNGTTFDSADGFAIEDAIFHKMDNSASGLVTWSPGEWFVTTASVSIQNTINLATAGDTIHVASGTYHEQLTISKALTLRGEDGAVLDGTGLVPTWTTGIKIRCGNVTIDNIDVTKFTQDGITAYDNIDMPNLQIVNCRVSDIQPGYWGFGIYVGYESEGWGYTPPDLTDHLDFTGLLIANNEITNTHSSGLVLQAITGTPGSLVVSNNTVHGISLNSGIWVDCARNLTIVDNFVAENKWGIEFTALAEPWYTLDGSYGPKDILLQGNVIRDNAQQGVVLYNGWPSTIALLQNWIEGNGTGVQNFLSADLNVDRNYWGAADGPGSLGTGSGDTISTFVNYDSWYDSSAMDHLVFGGVLVDDDFNDTTPGWGLYAFTNIQQGVEAAGIGGTVSVNPGIYVEQVEIAKDLLLQGTAPGVVIQSPAVLTKSFTTSAANKPIVYVHNAMSVTVSNVTVDGLGRGNANYRFSGITFYNAGGAAIGTTVTGIRNTPFDGSQHGVGVYAYNQDTAPRTLAVTGCTIDDCQKNAMALNGENLTVDVENNVLRGHGPTAITAENGIQVGFGAGGVVANNDISGYVYTGYGPPSYWAAAGILIYDASATVLSNIVSLSQAAIDVTYPRAGMGPVSYNSLVGDWWTISLYSTNPAFVLDAANNWFGSELGPVSEQVVGADASPWLTAKPAHVNALYLEANTNSIFITPGETIIVDMNVANLTQAVSSCQAMLGYSSTYFADPTGGAIQAGGGVWTELIWDSWRDSTNAAPGEIDTAIGLDLGGTVSTTEDGTVAKITLTARTNVEGITQIVFRPDADADGARVESTLLSVVGGAYPIWPAKVNSCNLIIDGTAPSMASSNITAVQNQPTPGGTNAVVSVKDGSNTVCQGTVLISVEASDALADLSGPPTVVLSNGIYGATATLTGEDPEGIYNYTWVVDSSTPNGVWAATVTATDNAGNATQQVFTLSVNRNQIAGVVQSQGFAGTTRVVTFVATGGTTKTWSQTLTFTGDTAPYVLTEVPDGTSGISAKTAWSLRSKLPVALDTGGQAVASFLGADMLRAGDIDNSNSINVLDYSKLKVNWFTTNSVADIDGDGGVGATDYSLMRLNWFTAGDPQ